MKPSEQKYAMERIQGIARQKLSSVEKAMPIIKTKKLTYWQALKLIRSGKIKLNPVYKDRALSGYDDFRDVFDLKEHHDYSGSDHYDNDKYNNRNQLVQPKRHGTTSSCCLHLSSRLQAYSRFLPCDRAQSFLATFVPFRTFPFGDARTTCHSLRSNAFRQEANSTKRRFLRKIPSTAKHSNGAEAGACFAASPQA